MPPADSFEETPVKNRSKDRPGTSLFLSSNVLDLANNKVVFYYLLSGESDSDEDHLTASAKQF